MPLPDDCLHCAIVNTIIEFMARRDGTSPTGALAPKQVVQAVAGLGNVLGDLLLLNDTEVVAAGIVAFNDILAVHEVKAALIVTSVLPQELTRQ